MSKKHYSDMKIAVPLVLENLITSAAPTIMYLYENRKL